MKTLGELFLERKQSRRLGVDVREASRKPRGRGRPPPRRALHPRGPLVAPPTYFFLLYISIYPKNIGEHNRLGVPPPQASVATENQSRPVPAPCRRGESLSGGHLHHPGALHDKEGVVHPWGWGYVPVAMCLISLSLSCSWGATILMYRELFYYSWILWCFSPSTSSNGLSFPFEVFLSNWVFKDLRTLDVCLACAYLWWQWDITWSTWCMFSWSTCGFSDLVNLCIEVGTRFRLDSPVETLGHSLKFFVLVE